MTEYKKKLFEILGDDTFGICPAPMTSDIALQILVDYLLGEDFYIVMPVSQEQANTEIVATILEKYSRDYRKDRKKFDKEWMYRMTDKQITNALKNEIHIANDVGDVHSMMIRIGLIKDALNLIERQRAEIKVLKASNESLRRLNVDLLRQIKEAKIDAIREFAKRLKERCDFFNKQGEPSACTLYVSDRLAKEMVGDE